MHAFGISGVKKNKQKAVLEESPLQPELQECPYFIRARR